jgi:hypothetical protein
MPWKCPACSTPIRQQLTDAGHEEPRPGRVYRCSVCRLDLTIQGTKMIVAPLLPDTVDHERPTS